MKRVLLTGVTGFVGRNLCLLLAGAPYVVRAALRSPRTEPAGVAEAAGRRGYHLADRSSWGAALEGVDTVIHAAARAHRVNDTAEEPYFEVNARGTLCLARAALRAGVTRFIYVSTIKVNGEGEPDRPYTASDEPHPSDAYARSKWLGEKYLYEVVAATAMQGVVLRAPLVYRPGVKGNFLRLLHWVPNGATRAARRHRQRAQSGKHLESVRFVAPRDGASGGSRRHVDGFRRRRSLDPGAGATNCPRYGPAREAAPAHSGAAAAPGRGTAGKGSGNAPALWIAHCGHRADPGAPGLVSTAVNRRGARSVRSFGTRLPDVAHRDGVRAITGIAAGHLGTGCIGAADSVHPWRRCREGRA